MLRKLTSESLVLAGTGCCEFWCPQHGVCVRICVAQWWQHLVVSPWQHLDVSPWQHVDMSPWQHVDVSPYTPEYTFGLIFYLVGVPVIESMVPAYMLTSLHDALHSVSSLKLRRKNKNCTRFPSALEFVLPPVTWLVGSMYYSINFPQSLNQAHTQER